MCLMECSGTMLTLCVALFMSSNTCELACSSDGSAPPVRRPRVQRDYPLPTAVIPALDPEPVPSAADATTQSPGGSEDPTAKALFAPEAHAAGEEEGATGERNRNDNADGEDEEVEAGKSHGEDSRPAPLGSATAEGEEAEAEEEEEGLALPSAETWTCCRNALVNAKGCQRRHAGSFIPDMETCGFTSKQKWSCCKSESGSEPGCVVHHPGHPPLVRKMPYTLGPCSLWHEVCITAYCSVYMHFIY